MKPFETSVLTKDVDQIAQPASRLLLLNDSTIQLLRRARLFGFLMPFRLLRCIEIVPSRGRQGGTDDGEEAGTDDGEVEIGKESTAIARSNRHGCR